MPWATNPYAGPGLRTRSGSGVQQSGDGGRAAPVTPPSGGPTLPPAPPAPPPQPPTAAPPTLRTSIADGPATTGGKPVNAVIPRQKRQPALAWTYIYHSVSTNPAQMPAFRVPAGATVRVRASQPGGGNQFPVFVALDYFLVQNEGAGCSVLQSLDDVEYNVDNTALIWVKAQVGDGVIISVNKAPPQS